MHIPDDVMSCLTMFTSLTAILQCLNPLNEINGVCYSAACKRAARRITSDLNPDVKPCDNFYQFACGGFMAGKEIHGKYSRLSTLRYEMNRKLKSLLQEKSKRSEPRIYRSVKQMFQLCMDESKMDDRGATPGLEMLEKLGGWPVLGNWDSAKWSFLETVSHSWHLGLNENSLIEIGINADFADHTKYVFMVKPPGMPLPREIYIKGMENSVVKEYWKYMVDMAVLFDANSQTAEGAMTEVLQFQTEIAKVMLPAGERRGMQQKLKQFTLKELDEDPNKLLDWRRLFEGIASPIKLQDDQKIIFFDLEVIHKILALINAFSTEIIANHVMWNVANKMSPYLTTPMRKRAEIYDQWLQGTTASSARWRECLDEMTRLDVALSSMYVKKLFDKSSLNKAKDMMNHIQTEMDKVLQEADWMDEKTRQTAQQKSAKMLQVVGYPDELADIAKVEEHYKELNLNKEHFFEARLDLKIWTTKSALKKLNEVSVKRPWTEFSRMAEPTAYNALSKNAIVATAGMLQEPFFSASVPSYLNYANIGFVTGHEITHAFDDQGREYNDEGELNEWWDVTSLNKFNAKKQCFIDQYSSFIESITKRKVNGINTQGENIADNGGLKLAYRAYRRVAEQLKKPEPGLPGLKHYNNDQLFFISLANTWCTAKPFGMIEHDLLTDEHAPPEWRVNGMVMNMPKFGKIFGCDKGTPMNPKPEEKCEVW